MTNMPTGSVEGQRETPPYRRGRSRPRIDSNRSSPASGRSFGALVEGEIDHRDRHEDGKERN